MIAAELLRRGAGVRFVQAPSDWRRLRTDPGNWWRHVAAARYAPAVAGVAVTERSTLVPGSRGRLAARMDSTLLGSFLRRSAWDADLTVLMHPWEWPASRRISGRVVFDCTDDWSRLLPHARGLREQFRRIAGEADEVIVVNPVLADLFPGRTPVVVPNGTDTALLHAPGAGARRARHAVYVGSIAERFDVDLVRAVLGELPDWTLDVHGPLVFPVRARAATERFLALGEEFPGRFRYRGALARDGLPAVLDSATVALVPDVAARALGQSSMKCYDYGARGVPVVASAGHLEFSGELAPHTGLVRDAAEMAAAMRGAGGEPAGFAADRRSWAAARTWERRADRWIDAALGALPAAVDRPAA